MTTGIALVFFALYFIIGKKNERELIRKKALLRTMSMEMESKSQIDEKPWKLLDKEMNLALSQAAGRTML